MKYKLLLVSFVFLFFCSLAVAQDPQFFVQEATNYSVRFSCSMDGAICDSAVQCNISINYPNSTVLISNGNATNLNNGYFNYTLNTSQTTPVGDYSTLVTCSNTTLSDTDTFIFRVTGTGDELDQPKSIVSVALLFLLAFLFIITIYGTSLLPSSNMVDGEGYIMGISKLKYLRPVLYVVAYILLMALVFSASNISFAYLGTKMFAELLFVIYRIMFLMMLPMVVVWFIFIFVKLYHDMEFQRMIERGIPMSSTP